MTHHSRPLHLAQARLHLRCAPNTPASCQETGPLATQLDALGVQVWHDFQAQPPVPQADVRGDFEVMALGGLYWSQQADPSPEAVSDALLALRRSGGAAPLILFSDHDQAQGLGLKLLGLAEAWLPLQPRRSELLRALQILQLGGCYYPKPMRRALSADLAQQDEEIATQFALRVELTPRETEIWALVQQGCTSRDIAEHLGISTRTVDAHRRNLKQKQANSLARLAA